MKIINGVYKIENILNGSVYIGQATDIKRRWSNHLADLRNNRYRYDSIQKGFDLGESNIKWEILEEFNDNMTAFEKQDREQFWIDYCEKVGWTIVNKSKAGKTPEFKDVELQRKNKSKAQRGTRNGNCQTDLDIIVAIKKDIEDGLSNKEIAEKYGKKHNYISMIRTGQRWSSVKVKKEKVSTSIDTDNTTFGDVVSL